MEIDPNLAKLQRLIESKRSQQNMTPVAESRSVGRAGNPKFAAAAARAQAAMQNGRVSKRLSSLNNNHITKSSTVKEASNISLYSGNQLTKTQGGSNINMGDSNRTNSVGEKHLGQYIDKYA